MAYHRFMSEPQYRGSVAVAEGLNDGETFPHAIVSVAGDYAKLAVLDPARGRFAELDLMRDFTMTQRGAVVTFEGASRQLLAEVGVAPDEARVRWAVTLKGCQQC